MRVAILGNSGSGKSTLATRLAREHALARLDLDTIAFEPDRIAVPRAPEVALAELERFCAAHERWVVEGCYRDLIARALTLGAALLFLDPGAQQCLENCRARPFEPHKYSSRQEQDARLEFLLGWVQDYYSRDGDMSHAAHRELFEQFTGPKLRLTEQRDALPQLPGGAG
ncbi:MAG: shikimate kinase [Myxococcales bacterium]|nr:shikimate kinase [Myxococcales bacterium]